jgi:hypothetical protein
MRKLVLFTLLPLFVACGDATVVQPDAILTPADELAEVAASAQVAKDARWEVEFFIAFKDMLQPGEPFGNPESPVFHLKNIGVEWFLSGTLRTAEGEGPVSGLFYFFGDVTTNTANGRGVQRGHSIRFVIDESPVGVGTFECRSTFTQKPGEGGVPVISGLVTGCHGTGVFEGMRMKLSGANQQPLPPEYYVYSYAGQIW